MNEDDGSWWLLDSGASTTVMSSKHLGLYKAQCEETYDGSLYRAANGTTVDIVKLKFVLGLRCTIGARTQ